MIGVDRIVKCDDPRFLPLARSRIAAIRQSGMQFGSQKFVVDGATVMVSVKGGESYISIESELFADFIVYPKSKENVEGYGDKPLALASVSKNRVKFETGSSSQYGTHDWISSDKKHCITWSPGYECRYRYAPLNNYLPQQPSSQVIFVDSVPINVGMVPAGVGMKKLNPDSRNITYILVASFITSSTLGVYYFDMKDVVDGDAEPLFIEQCAMPELFYSSQPVYFSGSGSKFVTLARMESYWNRACEIVGSISTDEQGKLDVLFALTNLQQDFPAVDIWPWPAEPTEHTMNFVGIDINNEAVTLITERTRSYLEPDYVYTYDGVTYKVSGLVVRRHLYINQIEFLNNYIGINLLERPSNPTQNQLWYLKEQYVLHDLDARYRTYAFVKEEGFQTRKTPALETGHKKFELGVVLPDGSERRSLVFDGIALLTFVGIFNFFNKCVAVDKDGKCIASTSFFSQRSGELDGSSENEVVDQYGIENYTINVTAANGSVTVCVGYWPEPGNADPERTLSVLGLPIKNTEVSLHPIYLI